jgi:hypothetical protein
MITKVNQFVNELNVATEDCTNGRLQSFINEYEPEIIKSILGQKMFNTINTAVEPYSAELATLINGGAYTVDGVDYQFKGLKWITAGFVYYWYHRNNAYSVAQTGGQSPKFEVGEVRSMSFKMMSAWNKATDLIGLRDKSETGTLYHFMINSSFTDYQVKYYKGGKIKGLQWL